MEFVGNPGTGKTTIARILSKIFKSIGLLSSGHFIEVTRENLIGPYIGQTLPKVKKIVNDAKGGILFIDEAYSLNANSENDYGIEALSYIVKVMEEFKDETKQILFLDYLPSPKLGDWINVSLDDTKTESQIDNDIFGEVFSKEILLFNEIW